MNSVCPLGSERVVSVGRRVSVGRCIGVGRRVRVWGDMNDMNDNERQILKLQL